MAMTLRLSDDEVEALRRVAHIEHRSMQQVARAAIDAYVRKAPVQQRRREVPASELVAAFADLPEIDVETFRADQERYVDSDAYHDAFEQSHGPQAGS